ncbi:filamentous hemagglutinin N-terminal domain-containing protein [Variovorax rhizosphaerae]|uniref:Filamentous hemagglutinin N-terminal domain-containing protein n=1 Tax=Variovorax rhizosphaerae TaxID=1836200 RepID=A0ABU8WK01_9BURK
MTAPVSVHCARRPLRVKLHPLALAIACIGSVPASAQTNLPTGLTQLRGGVCVVAGAVCQSAFTQVDAGVTAMTIRQSTLRAVGQWNTFNIDFGSSVRVDQQMGVNSVLLNRVVGGKETQIMGALNANGHVFLVNPNGVTFGPTASVNVGGLVASTLNVSNDNVMDETTRTFKFTNGGGTVLNQGTITGAPKGTIALLGGTVRNEGNINVAQGTAGLAAGDSVTVDLQGDGLTTFKVSAFASIASVINKGTVQADGGHIVLMADVYGLGSSVVNQSGTLIAQSMESRNGEIVLQGGQRGTVMVGGKLDASAADAQSGGGTITTKGYTVTVDPAVSINARGGANGANGSWTLSANTDLRVRSPGDTIGYKDLSTVDTKTIGDTLGKGTNVTLESNAVAIGDSPGYGVNFAQNSQILKEAGDAATLTVNSRRNIVMENGSSIVSKSGALNVNFDSDSAGSDAPPVISINGTFEPRGSIVLGTKEIPVNEDGGPTMGATIRTNGGDINFYGQGKPATGRAVSEAIPVVAADEEDATERVAAGIELNRSRVSTCGIDQVACNTGGNISMRGEGQSFSVALGDESLGVGNGGVIIRGSGITTGSGNIAIEGRGGLNTSGIDVRADVFSVPFGSIVLNSGINASTGDISLLGSSRNLGANDPHPTSVDAGSGITISGTPIVTGGNLKLEGTAADISGITPSALNVGQTYDAGTGVSLVDTTLSAGNGKNLTVLGTTGSQEFEIVGTEGAPVVQTNFGNAWSVDINGGQMTAPGGNLTVNGQGGNVRIDACCRPLGGPPLSVAGFTEEDIGVLLSTASTTGPGGNIVVQGRNVLIRNGDGDEVVALDSSGAGKAGTVNVHAIGAAGPESSGVLELDNTAVLVASASRLTGDGGTITAKGDNTIKAHGVFEAKGGVNGGNGGQIETSGAAFDLQGISVDASAPTGTAGTWLIDPFKVTINHGDEGGGLDGDTFTPLVDSTILDGDINRALIGSNVTIYTGIGEPTNGVSITMDNVQIAYAGDKGPRTFTLNANRGISMFGGTIAGYGADPFNVALNADFNNSAPTTGAAGAVSIFNGAAIYSNGGTITMKGALGKTDLGGCAICIAGSTIDSRGGNTVTATGETGINTYSKGNDASRGGNVSLVGRDSRVPNGLRQTSGAVLINASTINASTGNVDVLGTSTVGSGIVVTTNQAPTGIFTTSGGITLNGVGSFAGSGFAGNSASTPGHGVQIDAQAFSGATATLQSKDGNITVNGLRLAGAAGTAPNNGVLLGARSLVASTGTGNITITGETQGAAAGVLLAGATAPLPEQEIPGDPGALVTGKNVVVLRAANDRSVDALSVGAHVGGATVIAGTVLNLRPGGVDVAGTPDALVVTPVDRTANPVTLGGTAVTGFAISADTLTRMQAPTLVVGSNAHAGNIDVVGTLNIAKLTLQNGGGGNITLNAPVSGTEIGLLSVGNITQAKGAPITAGKLLALSTGGNVLLDNPANNVSTDTVGGGAAGIFRYFDADSVAIGAVTVTGFDAAGNLPQSLATTSMEADQVLVRTLTGDLMLAGNVRSTTSTDLVAAATFQNPDNFAISGAPWRVRANTWVGEKRGDLAGSGPLPNYYNCTYLGLCAVTVSPTDNHFIYAQQPTAGIAIANASRVEGADNPPFVFSVSGLILGDTNAAFSGNPSSTADRNSPPGVYTIDGVNFVSPAGYAFTVTPGRLTVTQAPIVEPPVPRPRRTDFSGLPKPDVLREEPTTYVYDRNLGQAPICVATGALDGDRAGQGGDVLAREWSRVRSRPNLLNCVNTDRRDGCAAF